MRRFGVQVMTAAGFSRHAVTVVLVGVLAGASSGGSSRGVAAAEDALLSGKVVSSIGERLAEQHPIHSQVRDQHRADAERHGAEHAEEAQRLLGEAHQEEDAEQVEQMMHVLARPVDARMAILR